MTDGSVALTFLELPEEAEALLELERRSKGLDGPVRVIALTLEAQAILSRVGRAFDSTVPFFNNEGHVEVVRGIETFHARFEREVAEGVGSGSYHRTLTDSAIFAAQYCINYFLFYTHIVEEAIDRISPSRVLTFDIPGLVATGYTARGDYPRIRDGEQFSGEIVRRVCERKGIPVEGYVVGGGFCRDQAIRQGEENLEMNPASWLARSYRLMTRLLCHRRRGLVLYLPGGGGNARAILDELPRSHSMVLTDRVTLKGFVLACCRVLGIIQGPIALPVACWDIGVAGRGSASDIPRSYSNCLHALRGQIVYRGIDFMDIFGAKLQQELPTYLESLSQRILHRISILSCLPIEAIISTGLRQENLAVGEWAKASGIPLVMISHGTVIAPKNWMEEVENRNLGRSLGLSPVVHTLAIQTPLEEEHVRYFSPKCRKVRTGPILFSDPSFKPQPLEENEIQVTLASSFKSRDALRFWAMETHDEYMQTCRDLVKATEESAKNIRLTIRFHPKLTMRDEDFRRLLPPTNRLKISRGGQFIDSIERSHLVVNFSSTSIEEALQNSVPVLLYDPWGRYKHCRAYEIKEAASIPARASYYLRFRHLLRPAIEGIVSAHRSDEACERDLFSEWRFPPDSVHPFRRVLAEAVRTKLSRAMKGERRWDE